MLLKRQLQTIIGKSPKLAIKEFVNWGKTQKANVISCHPTNKEEVSIVIQAVNEYKGKVKIRCAGSCHSWSPLFADSNNVLIYVDKIKSDYEDKSKIRMSNKEMCEVDIMTGVTTDELRNFELKHNVNLEANVILEAVQMVSVVATGCHGVGRGTMSPSDHVVRMRIFDSEGELRTYYKDEDPELFKAVAANFGCFGVIFDMTMKLKPLRIVKTENTYHRLGDIFQNAYMMKEMVEENWSVELFWFPYNSFSHVDNYDPANDEIWVRQINDETKQVGLKQHKFYRNKAFVDYVTSHELAAMTPILVQHPKLTPLFSFFGFNTIKAIIDPVGPIHQELPQAIHFRRYIHLAPVNDMEFAFDVGDDYEKVIQIINVVVSKVKDSITEQKFPLNIALEMRFMGYSEACLCPANIGNPETGGTGQVFYCEVLSVSGTPGWEDFCIYVAEEWMKLGGIPHLAKEWSFIPNVEKAIKTKMMKGITSFTTQLSKSGADPNGMFLNSTLQRLLFEPISEL
ncbi:hypothetical protein FSP39_000135 [Pinctada imbricata]|uniref:FAD-binding PCMH-type domain-containing protein n=1 Tax=Pinctada imbricata TaxID=66713 RepID=A0AA88YGM7_PINIB|nr:hypothetical protein FSP39_000135 [Pinctada imbricata]